MAKATRLIASLSVIILLMVPLVSFSADSLVPCGITSPEVLKDHPTYAEPCGWKTFVGLAYKLITFFLFKLALPIAAIMFAWVGVRLVTSGGGEEARTSLKQAFWNIVLGLIIAAAAWLIVKFVLQLLGFEGSWIGL